MTMSGLSTPPDNLPSFSFYWSIIVLQCCISFCCNVKWISYMHTYIPSLLDLSPSPAPSYPPRSSQRAERPVLYSRFPLASYFTHGHVYMSIPILWSILTSVYEGYLIPSPFSANLIHFLSISLSQLVVCFLCNWNNKNNQKGHSCSLITNRTASVAKYAFFPIILINCQNYYLKLEPPTIHTFSSLLVSTFLFL